MASRSSLLFSLPPRCDPRALKATGVERDGGSIQSRLVNITKHVLKPKHEVLTVEEKVKLQKDYNVVDSHLPLMLESDAVAHYQGFRQGTVVKVTYDNELTGNHVTYRCIF
ncbi:DNA-directed RNA polymerase V subunit 5A [Sorghum bicolor]|uniref:RNA polymerase subunit H/Rpb5 C-terminal domain-containing protein n=1 Tax=Sorghum bicolor TaxID=4558 RepID=A0A1B6PB03_SORBI|nr:DNA-directed RNA polymerase V subunit 5A [Sorghum bicolor]KXG22818.2 hypothetical protein SORBI_3008G012200 [Sorghum bicolor]|eukprot:XP_021301856.1 DNA-directed RNA polymerase V subunit 5A [Sorghum bicolor]